MSDFTAIAEERIGVTLCGKYRLESLLGVGGMASVYRGTHRNGHRVAVKVLHPHLSLNADLRARFLREGYVANKVEHRGAVRVLDDDIAKDGSVFLVMELLEGDTLDARWVRGGRKLPIREVCELAHQLVDVLAAAHEAGIVHRDIKPENLFLTREGVLKVLDFGIARLQDPATAQAATRTGRMLGTPAYMAPEQALGKSRSIDGQTDLWSAGATMFTLASGQLVHDAETVEELLVFSGSRPARSLAAVAPDISPAIVAVVDRALQFDKAKRWPTARTMEAALEAAYLEVFGAPMPGARSRAAFTDTAFRATAHSPVPGTTPAAPSAPIAPAPARTERTQYAAPIDDLVMPTLDSTEINANALPAASAQRMPGATTTAGIDSSGPERGATKSARRVPRWSWAVGGVFLLAAGWAGTRALSADPPVATSAPTTDANHVTTAAAPPSAASTATSAPIAESHPEVATVDVTHLPAAPAVPARSAGRTPAAPRPRAAPSASAAAPSVAPPSASPAPPPPNCDPPYTIGEGGHHILKPGCD